jgi:hypothetical protein
LKKITKKWEKITNFLKPQIFLKKTLVGGRLPLDSG